MLKEDTVKTRTSGLTVIEILVVVSIIAILVGLLLPAVHTVQKMAKETKQKAQFTSIELGLAAFKSDFGDYPPSSWWNPAIPGAQPQNYCGAQKLAEALLGWDLLGFHPDSAWRADGLDRTNGPTTYDPLKTDPAATTLSKRRGRYLELEVANPFMLGWSGTGAQDGLFAGTDPLAARTYVLCDVFGVNERKVMLPGGKMVSPGTPILYYKANPASKIHDASVQPEANIYNARDNVPLVALGRVADGAKPVGARRPHQLLPDLVAPGFQYFYEYLRDLRVQARPWPYRPDSYVLISAGADGLYGTNDDIRNFGQ
jgi:type II secretory pathway pseudopilin PulG